MKTKEFQYVPQWAKYYNSVAGGIFFSEKGYCFVKEADRYKSTFRTRWAPGDAGTWIGNRNTKIAVMISLENK